MMEDLEKDIKKYFEQRQIKPSADAWNRMEALLDEQQPKKPKQKSYFYVWSVAASVLLFVGLWVFFQKSEPTILETKPIEDFVVNNDSQKTNNETSTPLNEDKPEEMVAEKQIATHKKSNRKSEKRTTINTETAIVSNQESDVPKIVPSTEKNDVVPVFDIKPEESLANKSTVEIRVNREKLLRTAEFERQIENTITDGQNFWKKIKEANNVAQY